MATSDNTLRNTIIGTVVGGLILSFILWLTDFLPTFWNLIKSLFDVFIITMSIQIKMPLWLLIIVLLVITAPFIKWKQSRYKKQDKAYEIETPPNEEEEENKVIELNDLESRIIVAFARADGKSFHLRDLAIRVRTNKLRTEQALNSLVKKELIEESYNYVHGTFFFLTEFGKGFVIEQNLA